MYLNFRKKWSHFKTIHPEIPLIAFLCKTLMFTIYTKNVSKVVFNFNSIKQIKWKMNIVYY